jgi:hypothetical protein
MASGHHRLPALPCARFHSAVAQAWNLDSNEMDCHVHRIVLSGVGSDSQLGAAPLD